MKIALIIIAIIAIIFLIFKLFFNNNKDIAMYNHIGRDLNQFQQDNLTKLIDSSRKDLSLFRKINNPQKALEHYENIKLSMIYGASPYGKLYEERLLELLEYRYTESLKTR